MRSHRFRPLLRWSLAAVLLAAPSTSSLLQAKQVLPKVGGERQINVLTLGQQTNPAIAADAAGNYAIAWMGPDEQFIQRVFVRLFDASGAPRTGEIVVNDEATPIEVTGPPHIAMAPNGRFAVLWSARYAWVQLYDAAGTPRGQNLRTDDQALLSGTEPDLAMTEDGDFLVVWRAVSNLTAVYLRAFDAAGHALEAGRPISLSIAGSLDSPRVAATEGGGFVVTFIRLRDADFLNRNDKLVAILRPSLLGTPSQEIQLNAANGQGFTTAVPVAHAGGGFSVLWGRTLQPVLFPSITAPDLRVRRFDQAGAPLTEEKGLALPLDLYNPPAVASDRYGNSFVATGSYLLDTKPQGQLYDRFWQPIGERFQVVSFENDVQVQVDLAASGDGFVAAWTSGIDIVFLPPPIYGQDGNGFGIFAQTFAPPLCVEGSQVLCLGPDGRFELSIHWRTGVDVEGPGRAHRLTGDTGSFWFFDRENLEIVTKVLDGTAVNGHFWLFSGALSNVDHTLEVVDSSTGVRRSYHNPQGELVSRADTLAFDPASGQPGATETSLAADSGAEPSALSPVSAPLSPAPSCDPASPETLCFQLTDLYEVEVDFIDPRTGLQGKGQAMPLTGDSGAFTFFGASNIELIVKVLDGRAVNDRVWFFFGGLSNIDYTITVRSAIGGTVRTYHNAPGQLQSRADTEAFDF